MPPHPRNALPREVCSALAGHDPATLHILLAPEVVCHLPGRSAKVSDYRGFEEVFGL